MPTDPALAVRDALMTVYHAQKAKHGADDVYFKSLKAAGLEQDIKDTFPGAVIRGVEQIVTYEIEIMVGDQLNGSITIGPDTCIEGGVRITGSDDHPVTIGSHVRIQGSTYIYGCVIEEGVHMEHCFIKQKRIRAAQREDGSIQSVRFYRPLPEGMDSVVQL